MWFYRRQPAGGSRDEKRQVVYFCSGMKWKAEVNKEELIFCYSNTKMLRFIC